jgi:hypothetical protein
MNGRKISHKDVMTGDLRAWACLCQCCKAMPYLPVGCIAHCAATDCRSTIGTRHFDMSPCCLHVMKACTRIESQALWSWKSAVYQLLRIKQEQQDLVCCSSRDAYYIIAHPIKCHPAECLYIRECIHCVTCHSHSKLCSGSSACHM